MFLEGYKLGADDYIVKPFDADVLILQDCRAAGTGRGRTGKYQPPLYHRQIQVFDSRLREIRLGKSKQLLSPKEAALLLLFAEHRDELLPGEGVLKRIWGDDG